MWEGFEGAGGSVNIKHASLKMSTFKNEFSWSISRDRIFQTCPRQYYFNYYGYWGGWNPNAPERIRQIYFLKKLQNRFMCAGAKVHDCIEHTLTNLRRGISVLDVDQIVDITPIQRPVHYSNTNMMHQYQVLIGRRQPKIWNYAWGIFTVQKLSVCSRNFPGECG